uniref:OSJNBb0108J11.13 protein n=2 Tax=Oryza TaxID=4527 RepID=Q7FAX9_ORYSJ|nr:OSJNBb0108J11.13 [Oryza sativa Japonica Group]
MNKPKMYLSDQANQARGQCLSDPRVVRILLRKCWWVFQEISTGTFFADGDGIGKTFFTIQNVFLLALA